MSVCSFHIDNNIQTREMQCLAFLYVELIYHMPISQNTKKMHIKTEFINGSVNAGVCTRLRLQAVAEHIPATNYPAANHKQRVEVLAAIPNLLNTNMMGTINCWWFDNVTLQLCCLFPWQRHLRLFPL